MDNEKTLRILEKLDHPATIYFRSIEAGNIRKNFGSYFKNAKHILDLGSGEGIVAKAVFGKKISYGIDNDQKMVNKAGSSGIYEKVFLASAENMPFGDNSLDLVFANSVLEHIKNIEKVLSEVSRVLKDGGIFVFTVPNDRLSKYSVFSRIGFKNLSAWYGNLRNRKFSHHHAYSFDIWEKMLPELGMKVVKHSEYLTPEEAEYWDFLLIIFTIMKILPGFIPRFLYRKILRPKMLMTFGKSRNPKYRGSAFCIAAEVVKKKL